MHVPGTHETERMPRTHSLTPTLNYPHLAATRKANTTTIILISILRGGVQPDVVVREIRKWDYPRWNAGTFPTIPLSRHIDEFSLPVGDAYEGGRILVLNEPEPLPPYAQRTKGR